MSRLRLFIWVQLVSISMAAQTVCKQDTVYFADGSCYFGQISDSLFNGTGTMIYADSTVYTGQWKDGLWNGTGTLSFPDGDKYSGSFVDHEFSGHGEYTYSNGARYSGDWEHGKFNGAGQMDYADGSKYAGEWKDDMQDGIGILYDASSSTLYKGYFEKNVFIGSQEPGQEDSFSDSYPDGLLQEPCYNTRISLTYGTGQMFTVHAGFGYNRLVTGGISVGFNTVNYAIGKVSEVTDDEIGEIITLVGWNWYMNEVMTEKTYHMFQISGELGLSWNRFSIGASLGMSVENTIRNCRSLAGNNSYYAPGTLYFRSKITGVKLGYSIFADIDTGVDVPFIGPLSLRVGYGNLNGAFLGVGLTF